MPPRAKTMSPAAKRYARQKAQALAALRGTVAPPHDAGEGAEATSTPPTVVPIAPPPPEPGTWRISELREGQCRFACTPHNARPEAHRFCGQRTQAGPGNLHGSWCPHHLPMVWSGAKTAGGVSRAEVRRDRGVA